VPQVEQELLTLPEYMSLPPVFNGVRVAQSLIFWVAFCESMSFCHISFGYGIVCTSLDDL
jgi:hypothetical protein